MPGHFTHIYTARRVADLLASGEFTDWPNDFNNFAGAFGHYNPEFCGEIMQKWEKFTAIGSIGPDLFYFSQDYNGNLLGPLSDNLMLAFATYYYIDAAKEDDWEPLLIILDGVNSDMAGILRFLIKLKKIWDKFIEGWNATIGPIVNAVGEILDDISGGVISQAGVLIDELKNGILEILKEEAFTFADIFGLLDTCVQKGWQENSFLWSDMSHYRRTSAMCHALVEQAEALHDGSDDGGEPFQQFLAFSLGYMTHVGADTIAHSFVNEQCGGPYRNHPQRHHLIENHIDAWNYKNGGTRADPEATAMTTDPWGSTKDYPDLTMSALWFAVQLTPDDPQGKQRPSPLSEDPKERKEALDVDGEMPGWMGDAIVKAMIKTFADSPHPQIYGGETFQQAILDGQILTETIIKLTGENLDTPIEQLLEGIAPTPSFVVPKGFPLPWQIQTMYRIMITFYKFSYNGTWELQKPRRPDFIITPPASDFTNLVQPPDFSGVDFSDPATAICEMIVAILEWAVKELGAAVKLAGDLVKMVVSPFTYPLRLGLYELAMMVWDVVMKTHDVLAHTGLITPHSEQRYPDGELRLPNEIDMPLITLGGSVDSAFLQALADAIDPLGNLDKDPDVIGIGHSVRDRNYPYYPVLRYHKNADGSDAVPEGWEYHRPWAYPDKSRTKIDGTSIEFITPTPTETYDQSKSDHNGQVGAYRPIRPGPYPAGTRPDHVFFRTDAPINPEARAAYEQAQTPAETDRLNEQFLGSGFSPMGDPVPFSAYLIGRILNSSKDNNYTTQFNLDSDRGYGYLTWDWMRTDIRDKAGMGFPFFRPIVPPVGDPAWDLGVKPLQLVYVDNP